MNPANVHYGAVTVAGTSGTISFTCPQCGWQGEFDLRYPAWCGRCEHGLAALSPDEQAEREKERGWARRRREAARGRAEEMEKRLAAVGDLRPGGPARGAAIAAGVLVHLAGLAVLLAGVWLMTLGHVILDGFGLLCFLAAWAVRPRVRRMAKKDDWKRREDLPLFFGLLDRVGAVIGAPAPQAVRVIAARERGGFFFNAGVARLGLRRTPVMVVGIPLWRVLGREERLALLGHELGHLVNGDPRGSLFVGSARASLREWGKIVRPATHLQYRRGRRLRNNFLAGVLGIVLLLPLYLTVLGLERLLAAIDTRVGLRAEYLADEMAARVAGTDAALGLMRKLTIGPSVATHLGREKARRGLRAGIRGPVTAADGDAVWAELDEYLASIPEHEYERQVRASQARGTAVDADHPATHLRMRLYRDRPHREAALTLDDSEWEVVEKELHPLVAKAGAVLVR